MLKGNKEQLCKRCGRCCHHPKTGEPCPYLEVFENSTTYCTVYDRRFQVRWKDSEGQITRCGNLEEIIEAGTLPKDCPYKTVNIKNENQKK